MATIVLVHGIAQEQESADTLERDWIPALAGGIRNAGYSDLADRIRRQGSPSQVIDVRMAFYGGLFLKPGLQGDEADALTGAEAALADALATEWLERAATQSSRPNEKATAARELAYVRHEVGREEAGIGALKRHAVNGLARLRWFAPFGMGLASRFVYKALGQVTRYLSDEVIRSAAQQSVLDLIRPDTRIIIGHSLGSVVAYETIQRLQQPIPLFVTLGSPLGLDTVVFPKLRPQPPTFPPVVRRWVNVADRDDVVAAQPDLRPMFSTGIPSGAVFEGGRTVDCGAEPHNSRFYLTKAQVGGPIGEVLSAEPF
jgi:pimeloyl-ACP methyl ester carboxylesterase